MKKVFKLALALTISCSSASAAITVGHVENVATGRVLTNLGAVPTAGEILIGSFTTAAPTSGQWTAFQTALENGSKTVQQIVTELSSVTYGFVDVRSVAGGSLQAGFDWDWNTNATIGGTANVNFANFGASRQLFLIAYDGLSTATSQQLFAGRASTWTSAAADGGGTTLLLSAIDTASEVLIGFDTGGADVRMATAVPEPSRALLGAIGLLTCFWRRRR